MLNSWAVLASPFLNRSSRLLDRHVGPLSRWTRRIGSLDAGRTCAALAGGTASRPMRIGRFPTCPAHLTRRQEILPPRRPAEAVRGRARRRRSRSAAGVVIEPTQRPGRSWAWKSEPAIGTRPSAAAQSRSRAPQAGGDRRGRRPRWRRGRRRPGRQRRLAEIIGRVGQAGDAPRAADQGDRLGPGQPGLGHLRGAAVAQVAGERLAGAGDLAGPRQPVGQVATAERRAGEGPPQGLQVDREPQASSRSAIAASRSAAARRGAAVAARRAGSSSRTKWPRMWTRGRRSSAVSSIPAISSTPSRSASGRATARAESVSWSVIASAAGPTRPRRSPPRTASRRRRSGWCARAGRPPARAGGRRASRAVSSVCVGAPMAWITHGSVGRRRSPRESAPGASLAWRGSRAPPSGRGPGLAASRLAPAGRSSLGPSAPSAAASGAAWAASSCQEPVEDAVDEPARLGGAVPLGQLERLVDGDLGRHVGAEQHLVSPEPEDVAVDGGHPVEPPVLGHLGDQRVDPGLVLLDPRDQALGELDELLVAEEPALDEPADLRRGHPGFCSIW